MSRFWSEEESAYFNELVKDGALATHVIAGRMAREFGREFRREAIRKRLRAKGLAHVSAYPKGVKDGLLAYIKANPGMSSHAAAKAYSKEMGVDISGQLANYWRKQVLG